MKRKLIFIGVLLCLMLAMIVPCAAKVDVEDVPNGRVSISDEDKNAGKGATVTVTAEPDEGYELAEIRVVFNNETGTPQIIAATGSDTYTFEMKKKDAKVTASFAEKPKFLVSTDQYNGGEVGADSSLMYAGAPVTLTVTPDDGYGLAELKVIDTAGNVIPTTKLTDGVEAGQEKYTFTMPAGGVNVEASFTSTARTLILAPAENGTVSVLASDGVVAEEGAENKWSVTAGKPVTLQMTPNDGYTIGSLTIGEETITAFKENDGTFEYTLERLDRDAQIEVTFLRAYPVDILPFNDDTNNPGHAASLDKSAVAVGETVTVTVTTASKQYVIKEVVFGSQTVSAGSRQSVGGKFQYTFPIVVAENDLKDGKFRLEIALDFSPIPYEDALPDGDQPDGDQPDDDQPDTDQGDDQQPDTEQPSSGTVADDGEDGFDWILWGGIGGGVVILLAIEFVIFALLRAKRKGKTALAPMDYEDVGRRISITAESGALAGKEMICFGSLSIGRDSARCEVAMPMDTPDVGAVSCMLYFKGREGGLYLSDCGSGITYLENGERLNPGEETVLISGSKIAVGSKKNVFTIYYL